MHIELKVGPKVEGLIQGLSKAEKATIAAMGEGLGQATKETADAVASALLSGAYTVAGGIKKSGPNSYSGFRSRSLAAAMKSYPGSANKLTWYIGVGDDDTVAAYAYLLGDEDKVITPKSGKFLSIPSGDNERGVHFQSPRDVPGGFFIHKGGGVYFGDEQGGQFRLLFTMAREVLVQGRGVLTDVAYDRSRYITKNKMTSTIRRVVRHRLSELGLN